MRKPRAQIRAEWERNRRETNPEIIASQREAAVRGLSNYLVYASLENPDKAPFAPE